MSATPDKMSSILPTAEEIMEKIALAEAEKASEAMRRDAMVQAEKKALIDRLTKPSGVSDEEAMNKAAIIIQNAMKNGLLEVQVHRFPNSLCTDRGRAINQQEAGWETTLTGLPREIYEFWKRQLQPRGYKLHAQIIDFPDGMPGDVGLVLSLG
jgi:hypothetical protein